MTNRLNVIDWIAFVLLIIGGLNWGLVAFDYNLVFAIFGYTPVLERIVYILVGISAIYAIFTLMKISKYYNYNHLNNKDRRV